MLTILKLLLGGLIILGFSCVDQVQIPNLEWKDFSSQEAGFKVKFPCKPKKFYKSFQDDPRPIHVYSFDCETENIRFYVSTKHFMDEYDDESIPRFFEAVEGGHQEFYSNLKETEQKEIKKYSVIKSKLYKLENDQGMKLYHLALADSERTYSLMAILFSNSNNSAKKIDTEFEKNSEKFMNSFEVLRTK